MDSLVSLPVSQYASRRGRLTVGQKRALDSLLSRFSLQVCEDKVDWGSIFGRDSDIHVEIGAGTGEAVLENAISDSCGNYVAIERYWPGIGALLARIQDEDLRNIMIISGDAIYALDSMFADGSLTTINIFFPDPWPKRKHRKRRLIQSGFVSILAQKLQEGGRLHIATDCMDYARQIRKVLTAFSEFSDPLPAQQAFERPETKHSRAAKEAGRPIVDLCYQRLAMPLVFNET